MVPAFYNNNSWKPRFQKIQHYQWYQRYKTFLLFILLFQQQNRHPFMNKSTFVGVVGSSIICPGTWDESRPPVYPLIGRQTLVWAVEPGESENLPRPLSLQSGKNLESADLGRYTSRRQNLQRPSHLEGRFQKTLEQKKYTTFITVKVVVR